jgi:hypothetical protein
LRNLLKAAEMPPFLRTCLKFPQVKKLLFLLIAFPLSFITSAQTDSCHLRISLLTCSPGEELYSTFGHSALRVTDSSNNLDIIFNYGTFDFDDPGFYTKFARGKLLYFVSMDLFSNFVYSYQFEGRGIIEQGLNLSCGEKARLFTALKENAREANKYYKYDFLFDNCSSRLRDMVSQNTESALTFKQILPDKKITFRNLIHEYLDKGNQPWSKLGIDILLGSRIDVPVKNEQTMFLPDYLMKGFDRAAINGRKLVAEKNIILPERIKEKDKAPPAPSLIFGAIFLLIAILSFVKPVAHSRFFKVFDFIFFLLTGLLGMLLGLMWAGRDDSVCSNNLNLLWALPTHAIVVFSLTKNRKWVKNYLLATTLLSAVLLVSWKWLPQQLNNGLLAVVALLFLRSFMRYKN